MKTIIINSVLAIFLVAAILTIGVNLSQEVRNIIAAIGLTSITSYVIWDRKKSKKKIKI